MVAGAVSAPLSGQAGRRLLLKALGQRFIGTVLHRIGQALTAVSPFPGTLHTLSPSRCSGVLCLISGSDSIWSKASILVSLHRYEEAICDDAEGIVELLGNIHQTMCILVVRNLFGLILGRFGMRHPRGLLVNQISV